MLMSWALDERGTWNCELISTSYILVNVLKQVFSLKFNLMAVKVLFYMSFKMYLVKLR